MPSSLAIRALYKIVHSLEQLLLRNGLVQDAICAQSQCQLWLWDHRADHYRDSASFRQGSEALQDRPAVPLGHQYIQQDQVGQFAVQQLLQFVSVLSYPDDKLFRGQITLVELDSIAITPLSRSAANTSRSRRWSSGPKPARS